MTDIQNQSELQSPNPAGEPNADIISKSKAFLSKRKEALSRLFSEIRSRKLFKVFVVLLGIILLIVVGTIFSVFRNKTVSLPVASTTPQSTPETEAPEVDETETKLKALKDRVFGLEVYQRRLSPPVFDFKISF